MGKKITTLVVDDSALMRLLIKDMLSSDPEIEVLDVAKEGKEAISKVRKLNPDVVTLDVDMPGVDGLRALRLMAKERSARVVVVTGLEASEVAYEALSCGAVDFVSKPSGPYSVDIDAIKNELIAKVKTAASVTLDKMTPIVAKKIEEQNGKRAKILKKVVAIGASTGGPVAIETILSSFATSLPAGILIVQHLPSGFAKTFANRLNSLVGLGVKLAEDGDVIKPGIAFVAPSNCLMTVAKKKNGSGAIKLNNDSSNIGIKPSADKLMESVARAYSKRVIGVVLSGMGRDGVCGMEAIKKQGGLTFVQDEKTSAVFSMPKSVIDRGCVDKILPLRRIAFEIEKRVT